MWAICRGGFVAATYGFATQTDRFATLRKAPDLAFRDCKERGPSQYASHPSIGAVRRECSAWLSEVPRDRETPLSSTGRSTRSRVSVRDRLLSSPESPINRRRSTTLARSTGQTTGSSLHPTAPAMEDATSIPQWTNTRERRRTPGSGVWTLPPATWFFSTILHPETSLRLSIATDACSSCGGIDCSVIAMRTSTRWALASKERSTTQTSHQTPYPSTMSERRVSPSRKDNGPIC